MRGPKIPGGLRAQIVLGLSVMLLATLALGGVVLQNMLTRTLVGERAERARDLASLAVRAERLPDTGEDVAIVVVSDSGTKTSAGPPAVTDALSKRDDGVFVVGESSWIAASARSDGRTARAAVGVGTVPAQAAGVVESVAIFVGFGALIVLVFGTAFLTFLVIRPLRAINVATERAAEGDLASPIALVPSNELGRVATSFNSMLIRLKSSREELERKVAELERANIELQATRDSLVRSEKLASVGQLSAGIAHEIGNPLAALSGFNELLVDEDLEPEVARDILERSGVQLERIREVIRNLLDFSREEGGVEPTATSLVRVVDEAVSLVGALPRARTVAIDVGPLEGPPIRAVASAVVQVLVNLCMNALDALGDGGSIEIRRFDHDDRIELVVSDDGPGVKAEDRARLFDPFFTTKAPGEGTGLGLAICARIMEAQGGSIELLDAETGASFRLTFERWTA